MLSVLLAYKRPVDKQKTKNGGGIKKFRLRRTKILSFLLAYKRPVDKQKTQKMPAAGGNFLGYLQCIQWENIIISAPQARKNRDFRAFLRGETLRISWILVPFELTNFELSS